MHKTLKIFLFALLVAIGIFFIVFGEYDDSPGGQLLGLVVVIVGIVGLYRVAKKNPSG